MKDRIKDIIDLIELDYLEHVESDIEKRKKLLPITDKEKIKSLIWNLTTSKRYRPILNSKDFNNMLEVWFNRLI